MRQDTVSPTSDNFFIDRTRVNSAGSIRFLMRIDIAPHYQLENIPTATLERDYSSTTCLFKSFGDSGSFRRR